MYSRGNSNVNVVRPVFLCSDQWTAALVRVLDDKAVVFKNRLAYRYELGKIKVIFGIVGSPTANFEISRPQTISHVIYSG